MGAGASINDDINRHEHEAFVEQLVQGGMKIEDAVVSYRNRYVRESSMGSVNSNSNINGQVNSNHHHEVPPLPKPSLSRNSSSRDEKSVPLLAIRQLSENLQNYKLHDSESTKVQRLPSYRQLSFSKLRMDSNHVLSVPTLADDMMETLPTNVLGNTSSSLHSLNSLNSFSSMSIGNNAVNNGSNNNSNNNNNASSNFKSKRPLNLEISSGFESASSPMLLIPDETLDKPSLQRLPSDKMRISPRGTFYIGKWKIRENGLSPSVASTRSDSNTNFPFPAFPESASSGPLDASPAASATSAPDHLGDSLSSVESAGIDNGATPTVIPALMGGVHVDQFVEIGALGSGASGMVVEALHIPTLTLVALKMLPVYNNQKRQHVSRELEILYKNLSELQLVDESLEMSLADFDPKDQAHVQQLSRPSMLPGKCPNILSFYNAYVDPRSGMINLVIEYMDGGSLQDLVERGGSQDEGVLRDIAQQTLMGLRFLHDHKSVHRDIKPSNILTSTSGVVKIADFGISKALDCTCGFANSFIGTVCYMSPERITAENYSYPSDIWSLGLTMLTVSEGRFPLQSKDLPQDLSNGADALPQTGGFWGMVQAICDNEPPGPSKGFSDAYADFIKACLHKDPAKRLTASQLLQSDFIAGIGAVSPGFISMEPDNNNNPNNTTASKDYYMDGPPIRGEAKGDDRSSISSAHSPTRSRGRSESYHERTSLSIEVTSAVARRGSREISSMDLKAEAVEHDDDLFPEFTSDDPNNKSKTSRRLSRRDDGSDHHYRGDAKDDIKEEDEMFDAKHIDDSDRYQKSVNGKIQQQNDHIHDDENIVNEEEEIERLIDKIRVDHLERILNKLAWLENRRVGHGGRMEEKKSDGIDWDNEEFDDYVVGEDYDFDASSKHMQNFGLGGGSMPSASVLFKLSKPSLPSFLDSDVHKWENLAKQLQLPASVVRVAAKAKLGKFQ